MKAQRISLFLPNLEGGGAERVMVTLANGFSRAGFLVDLVLQSTVGPYRREVADKVNVVDLNASRILASFWPLARYFRKVRPHAILSTPASASMVALLGWAAAGSPGRLVVREAITASVDDDDASSSFIRWKLISAMRRNAYQCASQVVAPSKGVAEDLAINVGLDPRRITVIANPLDTDKLLALANSADRPVSLPPNARVVLGVGSLSPRKDFATLVRAFARACNGQDTVLLLLGEGPERENLRRLAADMEVLDRVIMPGFVDNPFVYMKHASVFVLSSRYEGMPNVLLQALLLGVPVVATDCPSGPREILECGRWGRLVPVGDVDAIARAILEGFDGKITRPPRAAITERYGVEGISSQYLDVLFPERRSREPGSANESDAGVGQ